jgi:hypothetical protein
MADWMGWELGQKLVFEQAEQTSRAAAVRERWITLPYVRKPLVSRAVGP